MRTYTKMRYAVYAAKKLPSANWFGRKFAVLIMGATFALLVIDTINM